MVRGGIKRDDGLPAISSTNIFSALESRRRKSSKKRSDKEKGDSKDSASFSGSRSKEAQPVTQVWTPTPVSVTSWADCEDDDDYFAMPALPPLPDQSAETPHDAAQEEEEELSHGEESEGDEEVEEEGDEENDGELEIEATESAADVNVVPAVAATAREPDRQLSKKELKKKELAELEAVLAELGLNQKDEPDSIEAAAEAKEEDENGEVNDQAESGPALAETKSSKRRKAKKEKSFKGFKEEEGNQDTNGVSKDEPAVEDADGNAGPADRKEVLKKLSSMKKKKSFKEGDSAAKAAAAEAAARAVKLAAAKKKEKSHYNQQPVR